MPLARTPAPPYFAVIFTSLRTDIDSEGYAVMSDHMVTLASNQPGFLGMDTARQSVGITVSYWQDEASIRAWRDNVEHLAAQQIGRARWYKAFRVRVARVEREYEFSRDGDEA